MDISVIERMSDDEAFDEFCKLRWGDTGKQCCPKCGVIQKHYFLRTRKQWRCKDCTHTFSVTSGTIFSSRKLSLRNILRAIAELALEPKAKSAASISYRLRCQYKTAWSLLQKIRESIFVHRYVGPLDGTIHVDGVYVCHYVRPKNQLFKRIDRRLKKNQNPKKRCVIVFRQLATEQEKASGLKGATKTIVSVVRSETQKDIASLCSRYVKPGSIICCDDNPAYDCLHGKYDTRRVNHKTEYCSADGISNNQAESYNARLRRFQKGVVHKFSEKYIYLYANQVAFLEDMRRVDTKSIYQALGKKCLSSPPSRTFRGYWQGNKQHEEMLNF